MGIAGVKRYSSFDDYAEGDCFHSAGRTVGESDVMTFAGLTGDFYPLHVDEEYSRQTPFGGRIAHGPLTMVLAIGQVVLTGAYGDSIKALLGTDRMRALAPVRIGDTISTEVRVLSKKESRRPDQGVVLLGYTVRNQRQEDVMTFELTLLTHRRVGDDLDLSSRQTVAANGSGVAPPSRG